MMRVGWPAATVAIGFLALVGVMFWRASADVSQFAALWQAAGPIVGVVIGAIPGAIFGVNAHQQQARAQQRAEVYARQLPPDRSAIAAEQLRET